jgi:acetyl esterase
MASLEPAIITAKDVTFCRRRIIFLDASMKSSVVLTFALAIAFTSLLPAAEDDNITWQLTYDGNALPGTAWSAVGEPKATVEDGALHLVKDHDGKASGYHATWKPEPDTEVVVEATVRVRGTGGVTPRKPTSTGVWPWRDGAPLGVQLSDGKHHEGLVLFAGRISTWTDRMAVLDTTREFHTYRLVIRGTDMSVSVDGKQVIAGQNAFWKPAKDAQPFIRFGCLSDKANGDAEWRSVRLGLRKVSVTPALATAKIKLSEPWPIARPDLKTKPTRPYVYDAGNGKLLMSVAEGPDAIYEPYGVMKSTDVGKTWTPINGQDVTEYAALSMLRLREGSVLGMSRWTWRGANDAHIGRVVKWDAGLEKFSMEQSPIAIPKDFTGTSVTITCERRLFENEDGSLLLSGYTRTGPNTPEGQRVGRRYSHLVRSTDGGKSWNHFSVVGPGGEPAIAQTAPGQFTAILRTGGFKPFDQTFSRDGGKTWSKPKPLEVGSVCADVITMSNGLLACSYGRPAGCLMFSDDAGKTWSSHHVITDKTGFNYSGIVEVSPGRLLYVHDGGGLQALYVDVERVEVKWPAKDYALRTAKELKPTRKIVYKKLPDRELEMHLFEPAGYKTTDKRPCFLAIHGGGWVAGTPDVVYCVADYFAKKGWLGISLQYRIAKPERNTTVFDAVRDGRSAVRYLRVHAAELGIDPNRIMAGGRSAGGHIAVGTALFDGVDQPGEDTSVSCVPNALILCSAVLDTSTEGYGNGVIGEKWQDLSPIHHTRAGLPPTLVLHGIRDTVTPVAGAKIFAEKMKISGNLCELILSEKGNHSYMMRTEPLFMEAMQQTESFLKKAGIKIDVE